MYFLGFFFSFQVKKCLAWAPHNMDAELRLLLDRSVTVPTPTDAFDLNYVFGDGDGNFDNNGGLDYKTLMFGTMTVDRWEELQPDRQVLPARRAFSHHRKMGGRGLSNPCPTHYLMEVCDLKRKR
jgi:hypothetical protein